MVCVFPSHRFVLASWFRFRLLLKRQIGGRALSNRMSREGVMSRDRHCAACSARAQQQLRTYSPGRVSQHHSALQGSGEHAVEHRASWQNPPSSLSVYYKITESVKCQRVLVFAAGTVWRETQIKCMQRASKICSPPQEQHFLQVTPEWCHLLLYHTIQQEAELWPSDSTSGPLNHLLMKNTPFLPKGTLCPLFFCGMTNII